MGIKSEACQVFIEQEIEEGLKKGRTPYSIGKELSSWVEKLFEAKIPPRTIEQRARRSGEKNATNVANLNTKQTKGKINKKSTRLKNYPQKEELIGKEFKEAWELLFVAIKNELALKWKTTNKADAVRRIQILLDIVDR